MSVKLDAENAEARANRTVRRSGNSTVVVIPPELLDAAGLQQGDEVTLTADLDTGDIVLRPVDET